MEDKDAIAKAAASAAAFKRRVGAAEGLEEVLSLAEKLAALNDANPTALAQGGPMITVQMPENFIFVLAACIAEALKNNALGTTVLPAVALGYLSRARKTN